MLQFPKLLALFSHDHFPNKSSFHLQQILCSEDASLALASDHHHHSRFGFITFYLKIQLSPPSSASRELFSLLVFTVCLLDFEILSSMAIVVPYRGVVMDHTTVKHRDQPKPGNPLTPESMSDIDIIDIRGDAMEMDLGAEILSMLKPEKGPKRLPTLLLYDEKGLQLFEEVCNPCKTRRHALTDPRSPIWTSTT
jgi:hypothetical protein